MRRAWRTLTQLLWQTEPRLVEFFNALVAAAWGGWLLLPWDSWGRSILYRHLLNVAPEWVWGIAFLGVGTLHIGVALSGRYHWRRLFSLVGAAKWMAVAVLFYSGLKEATATVMYGAIALSSAWVFIRIGLQGDHER